MKMLALAPWFGANRLLASVVGHELRNLQWVGIPFAGGMSELFYIKCTTLVVNDLHKHIINLAKIVQEHGPELYRALKRYTFSQDTLDYANSYCTSIDLGLVEAEQIDWACQYFITCWMSRSALAGTDAEFKSKIPILWKIGSDSNTRYRSAVKSILGWQKVVKNCNFVSTDVFDFLNNCTDGKPYGLYLDPPFVDVGGAYKHKFDKHELLCKRLNMFKQTRIVIRYYDHPLIRELYHNWEIVDLLGHDQNNKSKSELLIINRRLPLFDGT